MAHQSMLTIVHWCSPDSAATLQPDKQQFPSSHYSTPPIHWRMENKQDRQPTAQTTPDDANSHSTKDSHKTNRNLPAEFNALIGDLICQICTYCDVIDLLHLRLVCRHWSSYSRLARSWQSTHWNIDPRQVMVRPLFEVIPHIRAITIVATAVHEIPIQAQNNYHHLEQFPLLEYLDLGTISLAYCFELKQPQRTYVPFVHLRQLQLYSPFSDGPWLDHHRLESLHASDHWTNDILWTLSLRQTARYLRVIKLDKVVDPIDMSNFVAVEELRLVLIHASKDKITCLVDTSPALRILDLRLYDTQLDLEGVLGSPSFNGRVEYLRLHNVIYSPESVTRILYDLPQLLGLECTFTSSAMEYRRESFQFEPLPEPVWHGLQSLDYDPSHLDFASHIVNGVQQISAAFSWLRQQSERVAYGHLLFTQAPVEFRKRLLFLDLPQAHHNPRCIEQIRERFTRLIPVSVSSLPSSSRLPTSFGCGQFDSRDLFLWLRSLKIAAGLPLSPYERSNRLRLAEPNDVIAS